MKLMILIQWINFFKLNTYYNQIKNQINNQINNPNDISLNLQ